MSKVNEGRMDLIDEILSPDYVEHVTTFPGWPEGIEGFRKFVQEIRRAFPDLRYTIEQWWHRSIPQFLGIICGRGGHANHPKRNDA